METTGSMSPPEIHLGPHKRLTSIINPIKGQIMKPFLALVFSLVVLFCGCGTESPPTSNKTFPTSQQDAAIAEIKKLGGTVSLNKSGEVIQVSLNNTKITDAGLEHLKGFTSLTKLNLFGPQITDAGLEHLKGLNSLNTLGLSFTQITGAGLTELKVALPKCKVIKK